MQNGHAAAIAALDEPVLVASTDGVGTKVELAARLGADACEIYTDVEGIFTADPRDVPDARLIPTIGYEEMLELAHQGATVMQTRAVELGWVNDVIIRVRSTFSDHPGTSIQEVSAVELRDKVRAMALDRKVAKALFAEPEIRALDDGWRLAGSWERGVILTAGSAARPSPTKPPC